MAVTCIALLRGINVSGRNIIKMADLRDMMDSLGYPDSRTYIQSGNIVFTSRENNTDEWGGKLATAIKSRFGFKVSVLVFDITQLASALSQCPFSDDGLSKPVSVYITFMSGLPDSNDFQKIADSASPAELWEFKDRFFYLNCPSGYSRTKITNDFIERSCGVVSTTRNIRTVRKLISIAEDAAGSDTSSHR